MPKRILVDYKSSVYLLYFQLQHHATTDETNDIQKQRTFQTDICNLCAVCALCFYFFADSKSGIY